MSEVAEVFETMEYGPAPESAERAFEWLEGHNRTFGHFVGGEWVDGASGETFETARPSDGSVLARLAQGTDEDVDRAVRSARSAFTDWSRTEGYERARHMYALARRIQKHARLFAVLETLDNGKPIRESRDLDIPLVARHFYHHAGWAQLMAEALPGYRPVGVVGQIIPWNFPLLMLAWKIAPALAMGNTVILKPAEFTSLTALLFAELCQEAGLPPGVVNVVTGDGRTGEALVRHEDVDKIAFTGSTEVGRLIREATAGTGKKLSLELGGKSPFLVFEDSDLDSVVEGVVDAIWFNQGQVCCAGSRILVQEGIAAELEAKLKARMETLRMGDPLDKGIDMGAIVAPVQLEKIRQMVREGEEEGARIWQPSWGVPKEGWFYPPTLCTNVSPAASIAQVEIFGPVVVLITFRTHAEAIALANDTRYGLAASIWTENINLALDVAPKIKAGTVWVNCTNLFDAASGFGGYRESGFGREGGFEGLREYVKPLWSAYADHPAEGSTALGRSAGSEGSEDDADERWAAAAAASVEPDASGTGGSTVDRTAKLYVGGRQVRADGEYSLPVSAPDGRVIAEVPRGNRKDIRDAVEAARGAQAAWSARTAHNRAQILYYLGENLAARRTEFSERLGALSGDGADAAEEIELSIRRLFSYAAWADKWDGRVHHTPFRNVTLAMPEPVGVMGLICPDEVPLLGLVSLFAPAVAMGNAVVVIPSREAPVIATDFYQVLETSDVPAGVVNVVTGLHREVVPTLADHDDVDCAWYFGSGCGSGEVERRSTGNMKRTWCSYGHRREWRDSTQGEGEEFLWEATQIKNIWVPYGE